MHDMAPRPESRYSCSLTLQLIGPHSWTDVPATLLYDAADPYAVRITFGGGGAAAGVSWLVARDLLADGLERPAGDGDVRLWPASTTPDALFLHLRAPSGEALFELSRAALSAFLRGAETVLPRGAESTALDLDDELALLLANGDADPMGF
jgi:hypothetical protein